MREKDERERRERKMREKEMSRRRSRCSKDKNTRPSARRRQRRTQLDSLRTVKEWHEMRALELYHCREKRPTKEEPRRSFFHGPRLRTGLGRRFLLRFRLRFCFRGASMFLRRLLQVSPSDGGWGGDTTTRLLHKNNRRDFSRGQYYCQRYLEGSRAVLPKGQPGNTIALE